MPLRLVILEWIVQVFSQLSDSKRHSISGIYNNIYNKPSNGYNSCCPLTMCCAKCLIWMISFHLPNSCGRVSTVNSFFTDGEIELKHLNNTQMVNSKASIRTQVFSNYKTWSADLYFYFLVKIHKNNTRSLFKFFWNIIKDYKRF